MLKIKNVASALSLGAVITLSAWACSSSNRPSLVSDNREKPRLSVVATPIESGKKAVKSKGSIVTDSAMKNLIQQATDQLLVYANTKASSVQVVEARYVTWRDSSAGCPQPDMQYMQVLTSGALIKLQVGGKVYSYHNREMQTPFLCETPDPNGALDSEDIGGDI